MSPNCDVISSAAFLDSPKFFVAESAHCLTAFEDVPKVTSTLFRFSSKSLASLMASPNPAVSAGVTSVDIVLPADVILLPTF